MKLPKRWSVALFALLASGCSAQRAHGNDLDAGPALADAGESPDAGRSPHPDAGGKADGGHITDAGHPVDAGDEHPDGGAPDAGHEPSDGGHPEPDAGWADAGDTDADAGQADAGSSDAGPIDAGSTDAGDRLDAGSVDAGPADSGAEPDAGPANAFVTVELADAGWTIPDDFIGISVEWSHVGDYLGDGTGVVRSQVIQLLSQFAADGHHPVLRIGGDSEDEAYWNPDGGALPSGATVSITAEQLSILNAIGAGTGSGFVLGLNLNLLIPADEGGLVTAALAALPSDSVLAFELGNEPDLYFYNGYRPFYYSPVEYESDFDSYFPTLSGAASNAPLFAAPALYSTSWYSSLGGFLSDEGGRLGLVTMHRYPFSVCISTALAPTIPDLFTATGTTDYATQFQPVVATAAQAGLGLRIAEMNSVSCGGAVGVSDVFAAGLWGLDSMFELASIGAVGVNFHTPSNYEVFDFDSSGNLEVRGLYYALLLFSRTTAQHGQWLQVNVTSTLQVRAWATVGDDHVARVALINEDLQNPATVNVSLPPRSRPGQVWYLTAPAISATTDITFGNETFNNSPDGNPIGSPNGAAVNSYGGQYQLVLGPGSAALFTVPE